MTSDAANLPSRARTETRHEPPARRTAGPAEDLVDVDALVGAYYDRPARRRRPRPAGRRSARPGTAARASTPRSTRTTSSPRPRRSASTAPRRASTGRCSSARDTHGLSEPAWTTALEVLVANGVTRARRRPRRLHADPAVSHAILRANRGKASGARARRRHRRHAVAQPARRRRVQVQPAARRPGRHRRDAVDRRPRQRAASATGSTDVRRVAVRAGPRARPASYDFLGTYVDDLPNVVDLDAIRDGRGAHRRRPARRRGGRTTGARSASGTASTSPSSTRASTRSGRS